MIPCVARLRGEASVGTQIPPILLRRIGVAQGRRKAQRYSTWGSTDALGYPAPGSSIAIDETRGVAPQHWRSQLLTSSHSDTVSLQPGWAHSRPRGCIRVHLLPHPNRHDPSQRTSTQTDSRANPWPIARPGPRTQSPHQRAVSVSVADGRTHTYVMPACTHHAHATHHSAARCVGRGGPRSRQCRSRSLSLRASRGVVGPTVGGGTQASVPPCPLSRPMHRAARPRHSAGRCGRCRHATCRAAS